MMSWELMKTLMGRVRVTEEAGRTECARGRSRVESPVMSSWAKRLVDFEMEMRDGDSRVGEAGVLLTCVGEYEMETKDVGLSSGVVMSVREVRAVFT